MEHEIEITVSEHGHDADNGDALLGSFCELYPDAEAVIDQNTATGALTATFVVNEDDLEHSVKSGFRLFDRAAAYAGLEPSALLAVRAEAHPVEDEAVDGELVPVA